MNAHASVLELENKFQVTKPKEESTGWNPFGWFSEKMEKRCLMLGLDATGKTTILYTLKLGINVNTIPTIGFNVETVERGNINFTLWDVGGPDKIRALWRHYYVNTSAIVFVVDSGDRHRIGEARDELARVMGEPMLQDAILLVIANKQDLPNSMSVEEVSHHLQLQNLNAKWFIHGTCGRTGEGIEEAFRKLGRILKGGE
eukprot:TRINITY_DN2883_c0_g2_i1.p1 TRINITY_DN2883_c0_g2~~TRINITY_DN2883_c0_g2_i1.p1  ORF type:complete len:201 (-),score=31.13 TRINITY_DN2883_c0_g2_i1:125-727(-)